MQIHGMIPPSPGKQTVIRPLRLHGRPKQAGMTKIGLLIFLTFIGLFVFAAIRLMPIYLNYFAIIG